MFSEPFTFGIALIPRAAARSWPLVGALLDLTVASVRAQTDPNFRVVIAGHDRPSTLLRDPRFIFLEADWPVEEPGPHNADSGRKKHAINDFVLARGGGYLMFLDADDWVPVRLVETVRATMPPDRVGGLIETGFVIDFQSLCAAAVPDPRVFDGGFHRICGSSAVARLRPDDADPAPPRPVERAPLPSSVARGGAPAWRRARPATGIRHYVTNTSENHSEIHSPHVAWRRKLTACVNREGGPVDGALAAQFGLELGQIRAVSDAFFRAAHPPPSGPSQGVGRLPPDQFLKGH